MKGKNGLEEVEDFLKGVHDILTTDAQTPVFRLPIMAAPGYRAFVMIPIAWQPLSELSAKTAESDKQEDGTLDTSKVNAPTLTIASWKKAATEDLAKKLIGLFNKEITHVEDDATQDRKYGKNGGYIYTQNLYLHNNRTEENLSKLFNVMHKLITEDGINILDMDVSTPIEHRHIFFRL